MQKYKDLVKNVGILTIGSFGSKILGFLLIPLYTAVLTVEEYGKFDFINASISLLIPILTLNILDSLFRFLLDNKTNKSDIIKITLKFIIISIIFITFLFLGNLILNLFQISKIYYWYFISFYISSILYEFAQNINKGMGRLSYISINGIINTALVLSLNILFLLLFKMGLNGYFLSYIISNIISTFFLLKNVHIFKYLKYKKINKKLEKQMLHYSIPLIFNNIGWWIINTSDRYMIIYICGFAINGIYSLAYKIPSILNIIQNIFNQAWTISAIKNFDKNDKDNFIKNIYIYYNLVIVMSCSILITFTKMIAKILYMKDFYNAWKFSPFLIVSVVFGMLAGFLGALFSAENNTKIMGTSTIIGAVINIILNLILINKIGALGAAIATCIAYIIIWMLRIISIKKMIIFKINLKKDIIVYMLLILQSILILLIANNTTLYLSEISIFIIEIILYLPETISLKKLIVKKLKGIKLNGKI